MGTELIHERFARIADMLDDLQVVSDEETVRELRNRTRQLEHDYVEAFDNG